jgi:hypothetical protein
MRSKDCLTLVSAIVLGVFRSATLLAQAKVGDETERGQNAAAVLGEIMEGRNHGISEAPLRRSTGVAVLPHLVIGALGLYRKGPVAQRRLY